MHPEPEKTLSVPSEPSAWRRALQRFGLQGKLILTFTAMLTAALGASCIVFVSQSEARMGELIGDQAKELATALALSSEDSFKKAASSLHTDLDLMAANLVKSRNIVFVAFYDTDGKPLVERSRDPDFQPSDRTERKSTTQNLMHVRRRKTQLFGDYMEVTAAITSTPRQAIVADGQDHLLPPFFQVTRQAPLLGYVTVGLSDQYEDALTSRYKMIVLCVGCVLAAFSLPLSYVIVRRIFLPIRELVTATKKITGGDLDQQVAIHRADVTGELARAFNEMVIRVRKQQQDVELANERLAEANVQLARANEQLAEANLDLEAKVEQRTAQLEMANKRLSQEIAEKEDFLRAVSHDLNAPLRNIAGMATMLLMKHRDKFEDDVIHRLERIKTNVDVETDLISELLELSRIKTRRQKMEVVDVEQLVADLRGIFEDDLKQRNIELIIETPLPKLNAERPRVRQVFQNLIDNAIKYMGDGQVRQIRVGCDMKLTEAEFYVVDTGMGIEPEDLDKIFFVFRRGKNSAMQSIVGKGVGLASAKSIIETYSGRIWAESEVGKGSTFRFTINGMHVMESIKRTMVMAVAAGTAETATV
jgi:signal transduction histidine kinase